MYKFYHAWDSIFAVVISLFNNDYQDFSFRFVSSPPTPFCSFSRGTRYWRGASREVV